MSVSVSASVSASMSVRVRLFVCVHVGVLCSWEAGHPPHTSGVGRRAAGGGGGWGAWEPDPVTPVHSSPAFRNEVPSLLHVLTMYNHLAEDVFCF